ncbi:MAG: hypothetical protein EZS28_027022, partial [Streblomastix strix]
MIAQRQKHAQVTTLQSVVVVLIMDLSKQENANVHNCIIRMVEYQSKALINIRNFHAYALKNQQNIRDGVQKTVIQQNVDALLYYKIYKVFQLNSVNVLLIMIQCKDQHVHQYDFAKLMMIYPLHVYAMNTFIRIIVFALQFFHLLTCVCKSITNPSFDRKICYVVLRQEKLSTCDEEIRYEGGDCKCADGQAPFDCTCPQNDDDDSYSNTKCEDEKFSAIDYFEESDSPSIYPKSCICIDGNSPEGCVCFQGSEDLIGVPVAQCECCSIGDPISGLTTPGAGCLEYCTDNIFNRSCTCDSDLTDYTECEADKACPLIIDCNGVHGSSVKPNTCICIDGYTPNGCTCPRDNDLNQFEGAPLGQCKCLGKDDTRFGISCPISRKCNNEDLQSTTCLCSTNFNQYGCICAYQLHPQNYVYDLLGNTPFNFATCQETKCQADKKYPPLLNCTEYHGLSVSPDTSKCNKDYSPLGCNCYMKSGVSCELDFALSCLRSVPLKSNEQSTTISLLKEYLNSYTFLDTSLNPPGSPIGYGKHAVNININLQKINNITYTNTFDFYESIMILLNNLKDPHTIFTPPCVSKVYY